jgi:hypothetical protein
MNIENLKVLYDYYFCYFSSLENANVKFREKNDRLTVKYFFEEKTHVFYLMSHEYKLCVFIFADTAELDTLKKQFVTCLACL